MSNLEKLKEARATLDEIQSRAREKLKEVKEEAKRVREQAKKNAPDKAAKKVADETYKETIQKVQEECSKVAAAALADWAKAYEELKGGTSEATEK